MGALQKGLRNRSKALAGISKCLKDRREQSDCKRSDPSSAAGICWGPQASACSSDLAQGWARRGQVLLVTPHRRAAEGPHGPEQLRRKTARLENSNAMHLEIIVFYTQTPTQRLQKELSKLRTNLGAAGMILHRAQLTLTDIEKQRKRGQARVFLQQAVAGRFLPWSMG